MGFVDNDAAQDYENVKDDINVWLPKVKNTGLIAGDDYAREEFSKTVTETFKDNFKVEANNSWIHSRNPSFDSARFLKNDLRKQSIIEKSPVF